MNAPQAIADVARRTGISVKACAELIHNGWMYVERVDGNPHWERIKP